MAGVGGTMNVVSTATAVYSIGNMIGGGAVGGMSDDVGRGMIDNVDEVGRVAGGKGSGIIDDVGRGVYPDEISKFGVTRGGTNIPKNFDISIDGVKYYVHPNATKHMAEVLNGTLGGNTASNTNMASKMVLESFSDSLTKGLTTNSLAAGRNFFVSGNWELGVDTISKTIFHALFKP